jgi:hypothetical protein
LTIALYIPLLILYFETSFSKFTLSAKSVAIWLCTPAEASSKTHGYLFLNRLNKCFIYSLSISICDIHSTLSIYFCCSVLMSLIISDATSASFTSFLFFSKAIFKAFHSFVVAII